MNLTLDQLQDRIIDLERTFAAAVVRLTDATDRAERVTQMALARIGGHFTIDETAIAWGVSSRTIKRKINAGELTLEEIPGTRVHGIPADQVFGRWVPVDVARAASEREKKAR